MIETWLYSIEIYLALNLIEPHQDLAESQNSAECIFKKKKKKPLGPEIMLDLFPSVERQLFNSDIQ